MSDATTVVDTAIIVFREGLEAILIVAAVTASFLGANRAKRKPVLAGALVGLGASIATWFAASFVLSSFTAYGPEVKAITGLLAVVVLLAVLNWFLHNVYWTRKIKKQHARRRELLAGGGGATIGLVLLGFTCVYREGFEVVLFVQTLQIDAGTLPVLEGVLIGLAAVAVVGVLTFVLQRRLPYRKMLIATGVLLGLVLVVMVGGTAGTLQSLGWVPHHAIAVAIPDWVERWFAVHATVETIALQLLAIALVVGSYLAAERMKGRPARRPPEAASYAG
jgi:high-affinity iron transporter